MQKEFIEVNRVLSNKVTKENVATEMECIDISLIKTFRGWHKGEKDRSIKGDMTILILMPDEKPVPKFDKKPDSELLRLSVKELEEYEEGLKKYEQDMKDYNESKSKTHSMIIEESYSSFRDRVGTKVVVRRVE